MPISFLVHVNIRTANLDRMKDFYCGVLGMENGDRPAFKFGGAWLYCGDRAAVHLIELDKGLDTGEPQIEHFAFRAEDINDTLRSLKGFGSKYYTRIIPGGEIRQVHAYDPDGNHVEIAFSTADEPEADLLNDQ